MEYYAGIDVSLESSSVCVVDATGRVVREAKIASEPEALVGWFQQLGAELARRGWSVVAMALCGDARRRVCSGAAGDTSCARCV
jgi:predicted NBD/HSP70 family sugar kinase